MCILCDDTGFIDVLDIWSPVVANLFPVISGQVRCPACHSDAACDDDILLLEARLYDQRANAENKKDFARG